MASHDDQSQVLRVVLWPGTLEGRTASRCVTAQDWNWVRWRPEDSCAYRLLTNGGDGVVQHNDKASLRPKCGESQEQCNKPNFSDPSELWCSGTVSVCATSGAVPEHAKQFVGYFRTALASFALWC